MLLNSKALVRSPQLTIDRNRMGATPKSIRPATGKLAAALWPLCLVACVVFVAALAGILTRPLGFIAALWPANAILLGLFVVRPQLAGYPGWLGALIGFLVAGHLSGDDPSTNLWLTDANLIGVATGYVLFRWLGPDDRALRRPLSVLHMLLICVAAAGMAAGVGCILASFLSTLPMKTGFIFWFTTELSNYVIILPVLLTFPRGLRLPELVERLRNFVPDAPTTMPVLALCLSVIASIGIGGPGAIAFPIPALLWCSLSYGMFPTSVLVLLSSLTMLVAESADLIYLPSTVDLLDNSMSFRLGLTLLAVGPLTVATITVAQRGLLARLDRAVSMDSLTDILARRAYLERSAALLAQPQSNLFSGVAVLMIDIDHFKQVNDEHGHAAGDAVLVAVTDAIGDELRRLDLFGRLGGEEFAVTLPDITSDDAVAMAERLRHTVERLMIPAGAGRVIRISISIGINHRARHPAGGVVEMLPLADAALYQAKALGRNRIVLYVPPVRGSAAAE
ncbi:sensor domain-containing diguanylate cyclase [Kaistia terrae]|uniref:diguanylate cyclase n=1 Tax=Kaistia terrae TaxID=537017 RepID=A0ABW0PU42_9HYPH|nr:sensor domain-containing diguanylate cyclase [Kaistia terrae]MCX5578461.1 diguanylate cyclase [Kaistia terrae]